MNKITTTTTYKAARTHPTVQNIDLQLRTILYLTRTDHQVKAMQWDEEEDTVAFGYGK